MALRQLQLRQFWFKTFLGHPGHFLQIRVVRSRECSQLLATCDLCFFVGTSTSDPATCVSRWMLSTPVYSYSSMPLCHTMVILFSIIFLNQVASTFSEQTIASQGYIRRRIDKILVHVGQLSVDPMKWSSIHSSCNSCSATVYRQSFCCRFALRAVAVLGSCCCRATLVINSNPSLCTSCVTCCSRLMFGILSPCSFRLVIDRAATLPSVLVPVPRLNFSLDRSSMLVGMLFPFF